MQEILDDGVPNLECKSILQLDFPFHYFLFLSLIRFEQFFLVSPINRLASKYEQVFVEYCYSSLFAESLVS